MKKIFILMLALFTLLVGCNSESSDKLQVAVSIVPQETFVKAVAGDLVDVVVLIPPGFSPANYQPTPKEMEDFNASKVYFHIDVPAEEHILESAPKDLKLVDLAVYVDAEYPARFFEDDHDADHEDDHDADHEDDHDADHEDDHDADHEDDHDADHEDDHDADHEDDHDADHDDHDEELSHDDHNHEGRDPHIWLSPKRSIVMVKVIRDELIALDPDNKPTYEANAQKYIEELEALDAELTDVFNHLENRAFIMYHPSLGYFADDYGLDMHAIEAEGKKATIKELEEVIELAKNENIKYVLYQEEFDSSQAEIVAKEIEGQTIKVAPLSGDYINNLRMIADEMKNILE